VQKCNPPKFGHKNVQKPPNSKLKMAVQNAPQNFGLPKNGQNLQIKKLVKMFGLNLILHSDW
jgi:hypothetical protein